MNIESRLEREQMMNPIEIANAAMKSRNGSGEAMMAGEMPMDSETGMPMSTKDAFLSKGHKKTQCVVLYARTS